MGILDLIFPKNCLGCGKSRIYICFECVSKVHEVKQVCPNCYKPSIDGFTHIKCKKKYGLDGLTSLWRYEGVIRKALLTLKYKYATEVGRDMQSYIVTNLKYKLFPKTQLLVPIPMFWYKENVRGFNQSAIIGEKIAKTLDVRFVPNLLVRKKLTKAQVELKGDARRQNLKNVFATNPNFVLSTLYSVLVFDDVFTTGSTLKECAKVLKKAGVEKVWGLTIAR